MLRALNIEGARARFSPFHLGEALRKVRGGKSSPLAHNDGISGYIMDRFFYRQRRRTLARIALFGDRVQKGAFVMLKSNQVRTLRVLFGAYWRYLGRNLPKFEGRAENCHAILQWRTLKQNDLGNICKHSFKNKNANSKITFHTKLLDRFRNKKKKTLRWIKKITIGSKNT